MDINNYISHYGKSNFAWQQDIHSTLFIGGYEKCVFLCKISTITTIFFLSFLHKQAIQKKKKTQNTASKILVLENKPLIFLYKLLKNQHRFTKVLFPLNNRITAGANFCAGFQVSFQKVLCTMWASSQGIGTMPYFSFYDFLISFCAWITQAPNNTIPCLHLDASETLSVHMAQLLLLTRLLKWFGGLFLLLSHGGGSVHLLAFLFSLGEGYCIPASLHPIVWLIVHIYTVLSLLWANLKALWNWDCTW